MPPARRVVDVAMICALGSSCGGNPESGTTDWSDELESGLSTTATDDFRAIDVGDFDGDGRSDILRSDWNGNGRQYNLALLGRENGWERWIGPLAQLGGPNRTLRIGDFDGDGRDDLFRIDWNGQGHANNAWLRANGNGDWSEFEGPAIPLGGDDRTTYVGDFDGDGRSDLLLVRDDSTENRIYISEGDGRWRTWTDGLDIPLGGSRRQVLIADFDGDGDDDILRADGNGDGTQYNRLALSNGTGQWTVHFDSPHRALIGEHRALHVGDFDGDGAADLLHVDGGGNGTELNEAIVSRGDGNWGYWGGIESPLEPRNRSVHVGDFDGDGCDDILVADAIDVDRNAMIRSLGDGRFAVSSPPDGWIDGEHGEVRVADFDADGRADILRADWSGDGKANNRLFRSNGDGRWTRGPDPTIWLGGDKGVGLPEIPALRRDVTGYEDGEYVAPHIPPLRTSNDGRIAVYLRGGKFALIAPERIEEHFVKQSPGVPILSVGSPFSADEIAVDDGRAGDDVGHLTLCDGSTQFPGFPNQNDRVNPTPCGDHDCYAITTITARSAEGGKQLWATAVTVEVENPKTATAEIVSITASAPRSGPVWPIQSFFEPMFTEDGRLFVFRMGDSPIHWTDARGHERSGTYDMVYAVIPADADPCDLNALEGPFPLSHAPFHPGLAERYGFARYPFRDAEGNLIADGDEIKGTYPWIDRAGRNLFFPAIPATLHYRDDGVLRTRYPVRCVPGVECDLSPGAIGEVETGGETRGVIALGLWTRGKMVALDGTFANIDYGLHQDAASHREVQLYEPFSTRDGDPSGWIRLGTGRDSDRAGTPDLGVANTTFIDSLEHLFNYDPDMVPATPRDVVWTLSTGRATADVVFDGFLHRGAVVLANMNASLTHDDPSYALNSTFMHYHDGFHDTGGFAGTGFGDDVRLQNAAATPDRSVPAYGLAHGNVRIEPAAAGGIVGKGLWLDGYSGVTFELSETITEDVFVSLFVDVRPDSPEYRRVLGLPDGSEWFLRTDAIRYRSGGDAFDVALPWTLGARPEWTHLAIQYADSGTHIEVYLDGFLLATFTPRAHTAFQAGTLDLGATNEASSSGMRGWVDEFEIFADRPGPELVCNYAQGTLIGFTAGMGGPWDELASTYPSESHDQLRDLLERNGISADDRFACFHDYTLDHGILAEPLPERTHSVRAALLFPEGPLTWNTSRPDSRMNDFCTDCHGNGEPKTLSLDALAGKAMPMELDTRRQPVQPLRLMSGWIPADFFGPGAPPVAQHSAEGMLIDEWVFPRP